MRRTFADNLAAATATSQRTVVRPAANPSRTPRGRPAGEVRHTPFVRRYVKTVPKYHVVVEQPDARSWLWGWEIYRNDQPLPVRLRGGRHRSKQSAQNAGAKALREFLRGLDREQKC